MIFDTVACGKRIKEARRKLGLSQFELSERLDISPKYLSRIETGYQTPSLEIMLLISKTLNESLDILVFGTNTDYLPHQDLIREKIQHILSQLSDIVAIFDKNTGSHKQP